MNVAPVVEHYREKLAALDLSGSGLDWLDQRREEAFALFARLGFPAAGNEEWKYTRVSAIEKKRFQAPPKACIGLDTDDIQRYLFAGLDCWQLVFVNGQFMPMLSTGRSALPQHVTVTSLARALQDNPAELEPYLGLVADPGANGFAALNAASISDGAYVRVPSGQVADKPIHLLFITTALQDQIITQPRNLILMDGNSQATVIENYVCLGEANYLNNVVTEVRLAGGANLKHYKIQRESEQAYHIATLQVKQERDSRFQSHSVSVGALLARNDINATLEDEGAECSLDGLYAVSGRQHVDYHTRIDHARPHCTSKEFYKGVLDGRSRGVFNGKVYVHPDAQKTDAAQSNANLLLSRHAEVDTKPQLEIYADDVKCSHGATVGQLDDKAVFYLQSRGLDRETANSLLTYAFAGEVLERIDLVPYRAGLQELLLTKLPGGSGVRELM